MKYKTFPEYCKTEEVAAISSIVGKATVGGGTYLGSPPYSDGLEGKEAQYPHFLMYYMAWCNGHREYLLERNPPVA